MSNKIRNDLMLLMAALIWGASFVAQKAGMEYIGPFTFNAIRFLMGSLVLVPVVLLLGGMQKKNGADMIESAESEQGAELNADHKAELETKKKSDRKTLILGGISCGVVLCVAGTFQQFGVIHTTAGKAGFITALYIVLVPILGLFVGRKVRPVLWFCVVLATAGLYLLCVKEDLSIGRGDLLVIACAFGFATHILVIDYFSPKTDGVKLSCLQFLTAGLLSSPLAAIFEKIDWANVLACWQPILYSGILSCGVAYTLQVLGQKNTEPTVASLILSLESVFAVIAGIILLHEQISLREFLGCAIMFAAILLAQFPEKKRNVLPD
jgi:drug/metabolite transporter (DMT)-like permease